MMCGIPWGYMVDCMQEAPSPQDDIKQKNEETL